MKKEIFVSSTFKDFQVERELLLKEVQQEINTLLANKHLGVNFIDLRWGIDTNKGGLETVITFCIDYVNQTKPYLIILLGDSYGSLVNKELLEPIYNSNKLTYDGEEKSVTEVEIESSMIFDGENERKIILNRTIRNLNKSTNSIYYDKENEEKLNKLKEKIFLSVPKDKIYNYTAEIVDGQLKIDNIVSFKEFIKSRVIDLIMDGYKENNSKFEHLVNEMDNKFAGRSEIYGIKENIYKSHEEGENFYIIKGKPGIGKSSFASRLKRLLIEDGNVSSLYLINEYKDDLDLRSILESMLKEIGEYKEIDVIKNLQKLDKNKNYYFIIDSSDQIVESEQFDKYTNELILPENVYFVMFVNDVERYDEDYELEELSNEDVKLIIERELLLNKKTIPPIFLLYLQENIDKFQHLRNPSLLSIFISEICHLRKEEYEELGKEKDFMKALTILFMHRLNTFPKSIEEYFEFLSEDAILVFQLLSLTRDGLDEDDIRSITFNLGDQLDVYVFRNIVHEFRKVIGKLDSGKYVISNTLVKEAIINSLEEVEIRTTRYQLISALGGRGSKLNYDSFKEILYQYYMLQDYEGMGIILSLAEQSLVVEEKVKLGKYFQVLCNEYFVDRVEENYINISKLHIGKSNLFLFDYCLFDMSPVYIENSLVLFNNLYQDRDRFDDRYHANVSYYYLSSMISNSFYKDAMEVYRQCFKKYINYGIYIEALRMEGYKFAPKMSDEINYLVTEILKDIDSVKDLTNLYDIYTLVEIIILLEGDALRIPTETYQKIFDVIHITLSRYDEESSMYYQVMYMLKYLQVLFQGKIVYSYNDINEFFAKNKDYLYTLSSIQSYKYILINMFGEFVEKEDDESELQLIHAIENIIDYQEVMSLNDYLITYKIFNRLVLMEVISDELAIRGYEYYLMNLYPHFRDSLNNSMVQVKLLNAILNGLYYSFKLKDEERKDSFYHMLEFFNNKLKTSYQENIYKHFMINEMQYLIEDLEGCEGIDLFASYLDDFIGEKVDN